MSNAEAILEFLERFPKGVCDDCVSRETRVEPRQQVNQICRHLEQRGTITRPKDRCGLCGHTKTVSVVNIGRRRASAPDAPIPSGAIQAPAGNAVYPGEAPSIEALWKHLDRFCKALVDKHRISNGKNGLAALISALSDRGAVPMHQANMMHTIRGLRNTYVHEDVPMGKRETAVAQAAWDIIREWGESDEGELWRRTSQ